ncbi:MAG: PulJ/GspJ family protein [Planctomycetota bacterium]|jgi:type II secretory pathway pseudopilin PulG
MSPPFSHADNIQPRRQRAMTLVELLIALGITVLIGAAVASMLVAVAYGSSSQKALRDTSVRLKLTSTRLDAAIRTSKMVLESGADYVVLWTDDTRGDDNPNLSEIRLIERESSTGRVFSYVAEFPAGWTEQQIADNDPAFTLGDDFAAITTALKAGSLFPSTRWGSDFDAWSMDFDHADPQQASLVSYRLTLVAPDDPDLSQTAIATVALRNQ